MDDLFNRIFGGDNLKYIYDKEKGTSVSDEEISNLLQYDHISWEQETHPENETSTPNETTKPKQQSPPVKSPRKKKIKKNSTQLQTSTSARRKLPLNGLKSALCRSKTRLELANASRFLPPIHPYLQVKAIYDPFSPSDPYISTSRPCSRAIQEAFEILRNDNNAIGVSFSEIGHYTRDGLYLFDKFNSISKVRKFVDDKEKWLEKCDFSSSELEAIQNCLWHKEPNEVLLGSKVMKNKFIDVNSFSYLVGERYLDNFTIDVLIDSMFAENPLAIASLYLPTEFLTWMEADDQLFKIKKIPAYSSSLANITQILFPVHMRNHWGLVYIDLNNSQLYFDEGMGINPPPSLIFHTREMLNIIHSLSGNKLLEKEFWKIQTFKRFGMPSQIVGTGLAGSGSCGVGVVLAARDLLQSGPLVINNIKWKFSDMPMERKKIMLEIICKMN